MRFMAVAVFLAMLACAAFAQEKQAARPEVGKPVQAAQLLLNQKKYKDALAQLRQADAVPNKSPYETYVIAATRAAVDLAAGETGDAIKALEAVLATGMLPPPEALLRVQALAQLDYQVKDYPNAIGYAARYYRAGGTDPTLRLLMAQAYYLEGNYAEAAKTLHVVTEDEERSGKPASENVLLMLLSSEAQLKDEAGRLATLEKLVALYPKKEYWTDLLAAVQRRPGFAGRLALDVARLKAATGVLASEADYMDAAQHGQTRGPEPRTRFTLRGA